MCYIIPPHILENVAQAAGSIGYQSSYDSTLETAARQSLHLSVANLNKIRYQGLKGLFGRRPLNTGESKNRRMYNAEHNTDYADLPGTFLMSEGGASGDPDVQAVFDNAGKVYDFYKEILGTESLDGKGMDLVFSCHFGNRYDNAFWDGSRMVLGDGDQVSFTSLHRSLMVLGHEMTHGWIDHHPRLVYKGQSGALNESLADCFGISIEQWANGWKPQDARWFVGADVIGPGSQAKGLRSFTADPAFVNDRYLGTDDQPKHMKDYISTSTDNGGVHRNSGIPNHAFYLAAMALEVPVWEKLIKIWHRAAVRLWFWHGFDQFAKETVKAAREFGEADAAKVQAAWAQVGIDAAS